MKIRTTFWPKPIPNSNFNWDAIDDDTYEPGCPIGWGATKQEAIDDLMEQLNEPLEQTPHSANRKR